MTPLGRFPVPGQEHLRILIVTDAWKPQVNGVVTTLELLGAELAAMGHAVRYATPLAWNQRSHRHIRLSGTNGKRAWTYSG